MSIWFTDCLERGTFPKVRSGEEAVCAGSVLVAGGVQLVGGGPWISYAPPAPPPTRHP